MQGVPDEAYRLVGLVRGLEVEVHPDRPEETMNFHGRMVNIPTDPDKLASAQSQEVFGAGTLGERCYKLGHRDARHAAAEIANEADRRIEVLEEEVARLHEMVGNLQVANTALSANNASSLTRTRELEAYVGKVKGFIHDVATNWDCDTGANCAHHDHCRICEATKLDSEEKAQGYVDRIKALESVQATNNGLRGFIRQCEKAFAPLAGKYDGELDGAIEALVRDLQAGTYSE